MQRTTDGVELDAQPGTEPRHEGMAGLAKGLAIIEAFAVHDVMSVADAARASGATRAAARRCLLTLNVSPTGIISCVGGRDPAANIFGRSEEHTSELQSQ